MEDTILVKDYGDMLAQINSLELVSFETDGGYQGSYLAIMKDDGSLFYYIGNYGSCSGCDWLAEYETDDDNSYVVPYKRALEFCGGLKPKYIVPIEKPLNFNNKGEYEGFELIK